mmetsp:Transcript_826/g.1853  ORF Transcript_826/g.1853 Transcript_826/m.1853 type:complete len:302 (-) Transcript_826:332-1237(-)
MLRRIVVVVGCLSTLLFSTEANCVGGSQVTWKARQSAGGTCPSKMKGTGATAYDKMIKDVISSSRRRRLGTGSSCAKVTPSKSKVGCVPKRKMPPGPQDSHRRLGKGCQQCTAKDDDDDDMTYGRDDDNGERRQLYDYDSGYEGSEMSFTITADVAPGEDPMSVVESVEADLNDFFVDGVTSCHTWVTSSRSMGLDLEEGFHIFFSETEVEPDSVHVSGENDEGVAIAIYALSAVAVVCSALSAFYVMKVHRQRQDASDLASKTVEPEGGIIMNPLATGQGGEGGANSVSSSTASSEGLPY